jgi:hypothetical protein
MISKTMSNKSLSVYSPFFLQLGPKVQLQRHAQEIIWYVESQFHWVLLEVDQANFVKKSWMQRILCAEVVCSDLS